MDLPKLTLSDNANGHAFEEIFYRAICIADPNEAEKLFRVYQSKSVPPHFWRAAFLNIKYNETALVSAIVNQFEMPFGAYVIERCDSECIEIAPWMFSAKLDHTQFVEKLFSPDVTEEYLLSQQRMLELTAAFMHWKKQYDKKHKK